MVLLKEKYTHYLLLALFFSLSISKGIASTCEVLLILFSILKLRESNIKQLIYDNKHVVGICLIFVCLFIGMLYTSDLVSGFIVLKRHHRLFVIPFIILLNIDLVKKYDNKYIFVFILGTVIASAVTIIFYLIPEFLVIRITEIVSILQDYTINKDRTLFGLYSPFISRIQFSNLIAIASISCLYLFFFQKKETTTNTHLHVTRKTLILFFFLILIITSLLLGGKGGQLGLFAGLMVFFVCLIYRHFQTKLTRYIGKVFSYLAIALFFVSFAILIPYCIYKYIPSVNKRYNQLLWELEVSKDIQADDVRIQDFTSIRRIVSWKNTWQLIKQNPVFGTGTGDYLNEIKIIYQKSQYNLPVNTHSQYLYLWAALGIWGLLVFLFVIFYWLYAIRKKQLIFIYGFSFIAFYMCSMLFDMFLITQIDSMAFSLFMSLIGIISLPCCKIA